MAIGILIGQPSTAHAQLYVTDFGSGNAGDHPNGQIGEYTLSGTNASAVNPALVADFGPQDMAVSGTDLFVVNLNSGTVSEYTTDGAVVNATLISGLYDPSAIAISGSNLFVSNNNQVAKGAACIAEYTTDGTLVNGNLITGLTDAYGIAVSGTDIFVTDAYAQTLGEYTTNGDTVNATLLTGLNNPIGIAISGTDLYIADINTGIGHYSTSGDVLNRSLIPGADGGHIALTGSTIFADSDSTVGEFTLSGAPVNPQLIQNLQAPGAMVVLSVGPVISGTLPPIASFSINGPVSPGGNLVFSATTTPGVTVSIQYTTTPSDDSSWAPLHDGNGGQMTENAAANPGAGNYSLTTTSYPFAQNVSFRAVSSRASYVGGTSAPLGSYDLRVTLGLSAFGPASAGAVIHFTASPTVSGTIGITGLFLRVQASATPGAESSWTDLVGGTMVEDPQNPGSYSVDNAAYPNGSGIYFRVIAARGGNPDTISPPLGAYTLRQAALTISAGITSTSDPIQGTVTHIGDDVTYTFTVINSGSATARSLEVTATVPTYVHAGTDLVGQFSSSEVTTISSGGSFSPAVNSTPAKIVWSAGDLDAGSQLSETFTVHISDQVRTVQSIGIGNDYAVFSTTGLPPLGTTGYLSGASNVSTPIRGPIAFSVVANTSSMAPGGFITYTFTLANLTSVAQAHPVAFMDVPEYTRFAPSYSINTITYKATIPGVAYVGRSGAPTYKEVYWTGSPNPQIVIAPVALAARGDRLHRDTIRFSVTLQVQWVDPTEVSSIGTVDYGAAFLDPTLFVNTLTGKKTSEVAIFASDFASVVAGVPSPVDFSSLLSDLNHKVAVSTNDSGTVNVTIAGSLAGAPKIYLLKAISDPSEDTVTGTDGGTDFAQPGQEITFILGASNFGSSPADDVYIEDGMPASTTFVSAKLLDADHTKQSKLVTVQDPDGIHLRFKGLHLEAKDSLSLEFTVRVNTGASAPAAGSFIDSDACTIGSSSTPHTPAGIYLNGAIQVFGTTEFAQPIVRTLIPTPGVSGNDISVTANALTAIYNHNPNALPLANPSVPGAYISGVQRYYVHYANIGKVAATGVRLTVPTPAGCAFYRASFVNLTPNKDTGALGYLPGKLAVTPNGSSIIPPAGAASGFLSSGGTTTFTFNRLAAGASGDVMLEAIVTPATVQANGNFIGKTAPSYVSIHDATVSSAMIPAAGLHTDTLSPLLGAHESSVDLGLSRIDASFLTPQPAVGIWKIAPQQVAPGATFQVQIVIFNYGVVDAHPVVEFTIPANTQLVSASYGQSYILTPAAGAGPGSLVYGVLATNNGPVTTNDLAPLLAHTAAALTVTLQATGAAGASIPDSSTKVLVDNMGSLSPTPTSTQIVSSPGVSLLHVIAGQPLFQTQSSSSDALIVDLGGGNIVAQGGGNIVAQGGGNIVAQGGGNIVAAGGGNLINIGSVTGSSLLASQASIVAQGGGNIVVPTGASIVAQGGGNIVAAGGGNIVAQGGGNIVAQGGGNIVAQGGGNIVAQGGGNIVAQGGGNIVAAGGGNIVAQGGGNILASTVGSVAGIITPGGNIIAVGGSNFAPTGP
jgi:uncharacterized repeat protein (TIGR01451 family)